MNIKKAFKAAIAANDKAAFLAAAKLHGVKPSTVLPYATCDGVRMAKDEFQIFVESLSSFDFTTEGTHDSIRSGASSRMTKKAETLCFRVSDLAKATLSEVKYASLFYRTAPDSWVFQAQNGAFSDPVTWEELRPLAEAVAYQEGHGHPYVEWLKNLEVESLPA